MNVAHGALVGFAWLLGLTWLAKLVEAAVGLPSVPNLLGAEFDADPVGAPRVTVIVPARNEAADVGACVESLLAQDYGGVRVLAVDDRSTDGTGEILNGLERRDAARLTVMHVTELPPGWLGKTHAMAVAAQKAIAREGPDFLLFTDADILFRPDAIRRALAQAVETEADHFVVMPTTIANTRGEAMLLSYIQTMSLWAVRPWKVADPKALRDAIGVGAFNLIRTEAYLQLGGFEADPMEILEDLSLGRRVKLAGLRQRVAIAPGMVEVHWASGVGGLLTGMTKNLFAIFGFRPWLLLGAAGAVAAWCLGPLVLLGVEGARMPAALALISVAGMYRLSARSTSLSSGYAALFPVGAVLMIYSMLRSMVVTLTKGGVKWRGTFYPLRELRARGRLFR